VFQNVVLNSKTSFSIIPAPILLIAYFLVVGNSGVNLIVPFLRIPKGTVTMTLSQVYVVPSEVLIVISLSFEESISVTVLLRVILRSFARASAI
jgi:hypothetical protein